MIRALAVGLALLLLLTVSVGGGALFVFYEYGRDLPVYEQLADYEPPTTTRIHAGDGRLLTEFAREPRVFVPVDAVPPRVIHAFIAAEDENFFDHPGIDPVAILRASLTNLWNIRKDVRPIGASTITQQVAQLFLLDKEMSLARKIREAILSLRIERALSKERILELYLNEIYLGYGSYGVAAAALNYFDKPLDELTITEAAYLAALPKAPTNYHPLRRPEAARVRRDWVVGRMLDEGYITDAEAEQARETPFGIRPRTDMETFHAAYFAEEVRRELVNRYGTERLYGGGLSVRTTLDPRLQEVAARVLRAGLEAYDRRHGWRGPIARIETSGPDWAERLSEVQRPAGLGADRRLALVIDVAPEATEIGFADGTRGTVPLAEMAWARPWIEGQRVGRSPQTVGEVVSPGDVIAVEPRKGEEVYGLHQVPEVEGALVALDPHTGRVLAMVGGYSFAASEFNRATQAARQPGSSFKPIVYAAALERGFTPASLVLDAPFVIDQGPGLGKWKPANYSQTFYGPSTLRLGLEKSRNLMTVRLARHIGIGTVADYSERLGVLERMPEHLSMALGAGETTLLRLTIAYAMFVNGGRRIAPSLIDRVQDRRGRTIFAHDTRACTGCQQVAWSGQPAPEVRDERPRVLAESTAYQVVSMMEGVVRRGTGRVVRSVGRPIAGKTGTTNDALDAWFIGFSPDLVTGVFVGFDQPRPLGPAEQGASVAAPIFRDFMDEALRGEAVIPFRIPPGVRLVRVNAETGALAQPGDETVILEAFRPGTEPRLADALVLDDGFIRFDEALARGLY